MQKFLTPSRILLITILFLAVFLRFWNLGHVPPSTSGDEASIGYNAYSVLKTGGDEYGQFPLISQRAYDDWRRSTYLLLTIPTIALFGLQVISIRLPSVIMSVLVVWATYEIILLLFPKKSPFATGVALLTAFFLAISPWHIYISRLGHESNACLSFLVFGMLFFLKGLKDKKLLFVSILFFALSLISYYSGQIFIPVLGVGLLFIFRKRIWEIVQEDKRILIPIGISTVFLIAIFWSVFSPSAMIRFQGTSTFNPSAHGGMYAQDVLSYNKAVSSHNILGILYYNRRLFPLKVWMQGYFSHFNPTWLFTNDGEDMFKVPHMGLLYLWELPFILLGMIVLIRTKILDTKMKFVVGLWFFLGPLPASVATQAPHAMRAYNFLPMWQFFTALGVGWLVYTFKKIRVITIPVVAIAIGWGIYSLCYNYFIVFPKQQSHSFDYAFSQMMPYVESVQNRYQHIIFDNTNSLYQSYMVFLYYTKFDPLQYQKLGGTKSGGFAVTHSFEKYSFRPIDYTSDQNLKNTLLVGNESEFPLGTKGKLFTDLDGNGGIVAVSTE